MCHAISFILGVLLCPHLHSTTIKYNIQLFLLLLLLIKTSAACASSRACCPCSRASCWRSSWLCALISIAGWKWSDGGNWIKYLYLILRTHHRRCEKLLQMFHKRVEHRKNVLYNLMRSSSATWHRRIIVKTQAWRGHSENSIDAVRKQWQPSENAMRTTGYLTCPHHACTTSIKFLLGFSYFVTMSMPALLCPYCVLIQPCPHYVCFEHVQSSTASSMSMEPISRPYRCLLRSFYVVQVLTASCQFF